MIHQLPSEHSPVAAATGEIDGKQKDRARSAQYLRWFLGIPAVLYLLTFCFIRTASFERWSPSLWGPVLEWPFDAAHVNADVIIFGDSSAFIGIDPRIVNAKLGVKSIVLPNTIGSLPVTGDLPLRVYLSHNAPPKLIVLYFSAWNLDFEQARGERLFEGDEMLLRHQTWPEILRYSARHPFEILAFPLRLYSTMGMRNIRAALGRSDREREVRNALGHVDYDLPGFTPLHEPCSLPSSALQSQGTESVRRLARAFETSQTRVVVYLAPVPHCGNVSPRWLGDEGQDLTSAPAELPASAFVGDTYYAHIEPAYVPLASQLFAQTLQQAMKDPRKISTP